MADWVQTDRVVDLWTNEQGPTYRDFGIDWEPQFDAQGTPVVDQVRHPCVKTQPQFGPRMVCLELLVQPLQSNQMHTLRWRVREPSAVFHMMFIVDHLPPTPTTGQAQARTEMTRVPPSSGTDPTNHRFAIEHVNQRRLLVVRGHGPPSGRTYHLFKPDGTGKNRVYSTCCAIVHRVVVSELVDVRRRVDGGGDVSMQDIPLLSPPGES